MDLPLEGSCVCDAVRFRVSREPLFTHACHCHDCQKITGSAFAMSTFVHAEDLERISGEPIVIEQPTNRGTRRVYLCPQCQTVVWADALGGSSIRIIRTGVFANKSALRPQAHIWIHRRQRWVNVDEETPQFEGDYERIDVWPESSLARISS